MVPRDENDVSMLNPDYVRNTDWTVGTLQSYFQKQHDDLRESNKRQLADLKEVNRLQIEDLKNLLLERYETQTKAVDAAFASQQMAMQTAMAAAALAVQTALESAEKAVLKAEIAADKRFESVDEFRDTLSDQAATFMPRMEAEARLKAIDLKVADEIARTGERFKPIEHNQTLLTGKSEGMNNFWAYLVGGIMVSAAITTIVLKLLGV